MHNQDKLLTLKEASIYLRYTYRGFWGRIRAEIKETQKYPAGVYNIAREKSSKQILRVNLQEFLKGVKKHNISTKILTNTYENCVKGVENSYFSTLTKKTRSSYKRTIELFKSFYSDKDIEVNSVTLHSFIDDLRHKHKLADATIKKYLKCLKVIFKYSVKVGSISSNPLDNFEINMLKTEERIEYLKVEEREKINAYLLNSSLPKDRYLHKQINFAIETGLRKEEQQFLAWEHVDSENKEIFIPKTKTKQKRFVSLSPFALYILTELLNIRKQGNSSSFRWHDLRHTFGTWCVKGLHSWLDLPMNLQQTAKFMGHTNIKMTTRYAHLDISDVKSLINYEGSTM